MKCNIDFASDNNNNNYIKCLSSYSIKSFTRLSVYDYNFELSYNKLCESWFICNTNFNIEQQINDFIYETKISGYLGTELNEKSLVICTLCFHIVLIDNSSTNIYQYTSNIF